MTRGIFRTQTENGDCCVQVEYGITIGRTPKNEIMELTEQRYRKRGYKPEFDKLPWKIDYEARVSAA